MNNTTKYIIGLVIVIILGAGAFLIFGNSDNDTNQSSTAQNKTNDTVDSRNAADEATDESVMDSGTDTDDNSTNTANSDSAQVKTFNIDAFAFGFEPNTITASPGDKVTINLSNSGGMHDFVIDELNVESDIIESGETDTVSFTIPQDAAGKSYEFYCSISDHRKQGMVGTLVIT